MDIQLKLAELDKHIRIEQKSQQWLDIRKNLITASEAGYFLGIRGSSSINTYIKNKLNIASSGDNLRYLSSIKHGNVYEDVSRMIYEHRHGVRIAEYGLITTPKTTFIGASPDGIVSHLTISNKPSENHIHSHPNKNRLGRRIEIKNPYAFDTSDKIKPEYLVQIYQQLYVLDLPTCDFIKTNIIGSNASDKTINAGHKPYSTIKDFLEDIPNPNNFIETEIPHIVTSEIPSNNHTSRGLEKGIIMHYTNPVTRETERIIYPMTIPYEKTAIEEWISINQKQLKDKLGLEPIGIAVEYWYLAHYFEKTIHYDDIFEKCYLPRLETMWKLVLRFREYQTKYSQASICELLDGVLLEHWKKFITMGGKYNDITPSGQTEIIQHMKMALLLRPDNKANVATVKITTNIEQDKQPKDTNTKDTNTKDCIKKRPQRSRKVIIELDF